MLGLVKIPIAVVSLSLVVALASSGCSSDQASTTPTTEEVRVTLLENDWPPAMARCMAPRIKDEVGSLDDLRRMFVAKDERPWKVRVAAAKAYNDAIDACRPDNP
jgi:hypothetical protein